MLDFFEQLGRVGRFFQGDARLFRATRPTVRHAGRRGGRFLFFIQSGRPFPSFREATPEKPPPRPLECPWPPSAKPASESSNSSSPPAASPAPSAKSPAASAASPAGPGS